MLIILLILYMSVPKCHLGNIAKSKNLSEGIYPEIQLSVNNEIMYLLHQLNSDA
jgi:hypothetical protein